MVFLQDLMEAHVTGLRSALTEVIRRYIEKFKYIAKKSDIEVTSDDIRSNVFGVVSARHKNPLFETQTKDKFVSQDFIKFSRRVVIEKFKDWIENNLEDFEKIAKVVIRTAKARVAAQLARKNALKSSSTSKSGLLSKVDNKKFFDCSSNNPEECELFILEGGSAGGSANQGRDSRTQAIYKLLGKIQNVYKDPKNLSEEIKNITEILGCGTEDNCNIKKLRYNTIVFMADADEDGGHITTLLTGLFFKYFRPLIQNHHVYVAKPPLYRFQSKKDTIYISNQQELAKMLVMTSLQAFALECNNKKLSTDLSIVYLNKILDFSAEMEQFSIKIGIEPLLLEIIVRSYEDILKGDFSHIERFGYIVKVVKSGSGYVHIEFDKDFSHQFLEINNYFYEEFYKPIYKKLCNIYLGNIYLRGKNSKKTYGGSSYMNSKIVNSLLFNSNFSVTRFKGLGEMNPQELKKTAMDPETRNMTAINIEDEERAIYWMDVFLGKNIETKKRLFSQDIDNKNIDLYRNN